MIKNEEDFTNETTYSRFGRLEDATPWTPFGQTAPPYDVSHLAENGTNHLAV